MGHDNDTHVIPSDLAILGPFDSGKFLEAGCSMRIEAASTGRSSGHPFKRYPVAGRCSGITEKVSNGLYKEGSSVDVKKSTLQLFLKGRAFTGRDRKSDKQETVGMKARSYIYGAFISIAICCFLAEAILQNPVMMLWKHMHMSITPGQGTLTYRDGETDDLDSYPLQYKLKFVPQKVEERFVKQKGRMSMRELRMLKQSSIRPPQIALVCANLEHSPEMLYLVTIIKAILELGYKLELYTFQGGPMQPVWEKAGVPINLLPFDGHKIIVDWSNFEGVIVSSLNCKHAITSLMQEPFKCVPVIWIISEAVLGQRFRRYEIHELRNFVLDWKFAFKRADVIVFPDYSLPMMYSSLDTGNFLVIPGFPVDVWEAKCYMATHTREEARTHLRLNVQDAAIIVVGSSFNYKGVWKEHALIMKALIPVAREFEVNMEKSGSLKVFFAYGNSSSDYKVALQNMALHLGLTNGTVSHVGVDGDLNGLLWAADAVVYCSLWSEQPFPAVLIRAMVFERIILAPRSTATQAHIIDGVSGFLYPGGNIEMLTQILSAVILHGKSFDLIQRITSNAGNYVHSVIATDVVIGYAKLLEIVLQFPSEAELPLPVSEISDTTKKGWQWELMSQQIGSFPWDESLIKKSVNAFSLVDEMEWSVTYGNFEASQNTKNVFLELLNKTEWEEEKLLQIADDVERREEEEIEERQEQLRGSWEDIYRIAKRLERSRGELHERDDGELERTGQPICIYEPYDGVGAWPFLHQNNSLFRGISMVPRQRRTGFDDIEAASRLPLLNNSYYQSILCEYSAFFAVANRIDRIHKNCWIGFQSWRAASRKLTLSSEAERVLVDVVRMGRHGDAVYFWLKMDGCYGKNRQVNAVSQCDFWSYCDAVNNGNCRHIFLDAFKNMYGLPSTWASLPPMPADSGTWGVLHSWAMPTSSFLELMMFARMFVDSLDSQHYFEHHDQKICCLGISKSEVEHCYCRLLELLINIWAFHSAHRMIYVDPNTGQMHEQHKLDTRRGQMWIRFFNSVMLKRMDEDLAEVFDDEKSGRRWLWPHTGEVFSPGISERERRERYDSRMEKRRKHRDRVERIRHRHRQRPLSSRV